MMPARLGDVFQLMGMRIHAAGSHFVQQGFPDMGGFFVNQGDARLACFAELVAEPGDEFQPAGTAADISSFTRWS